MYKKFHLFFNGFWRFGRWAQNAKRRTVPPKACGLGKLYQNKRPGGPRFRLGPKALVFRAFKTYNISMKKYTLLTLFLLLAGGLNATTLNVLVGRGQRIAELSFSAPYAVANAGEVYGPIAAENNLKLENTAPDRLLVSVRDSKTGKYKSLGTFKGRVDVVRRVAGLNMASPRPVSQLKARKIGERALRLAEESVRGGRFITYKHPGYGGKIVYEGPFSAYGKQGVELVETVELERYVTQVVACELGGAKAIEALKVQSVLARSYALATVKSRLDSLANGGPNWHHFQLFATPKDQAYNCKKRVDDKEPPSDLVVRAVKATRGQVLLRNGKPVAAQYNTGAVSGKDSVSQQHIQNLANRGNSYRAILARYFKGVRILPYQIDLVRELAKSSLAAELKKGKK